MAGLKRLLRGAAITLLRPYIYRELPGWGHIYRRLNSQESLWAGSHVRWMRGKLHGYEMRLDISRWSNRSAYFLGRFYDLPTQLALMALVKPGDTVVDVGANEGMMSLLMARLVGSSGQVIAFEPNPGPRGILEGNLARNGIKNVDVRPCGLGDQPGTLPLFVPTVNAGEGSFGKPRYASDEGEVIEAPVRTGDAELSGASPSVIKMDVEGFEHRAIEGMRETLERSGPAIIMEMSDVHFAAAGTSAAAVAETMRTMGYEASLLSLRRERGRQRLAMAPIRSFEDWPEANVLWTKAKP